MKKSLPAIFSVLFLWCGVLSLPAELVTTEEYQSLLAEYQQAQQERADALQESRVVEERDRVRLRALEESVAALEAQTNQAMSELAAAQVERTRLETALRTAREKARLLAPAGLEFLRENIASRNREYDASQVISLSREVLQDEEGNLREFRVISVGTAIRWLCNEEAGFAGVAYWNEPTATWVYRWDARWLPAIRTAASALEHRTAPQVLEVPL